MTACCQHLIRAIETSPAINPFSTAIHANDLDPRQPREPSISVSKLRRILETKAKLSY